MAVVAVLLIHIERNAVTLAYATTSRRPLEPTHADDERREREAPVEAMHDHALGENEAADEKEDDGIGKWRKRHLRGGHAKQDARASGPAVP